MIAFYFRLVLICFIFILVSTYTILFYIKKYKKLNELENYTLKITCYFVPIFSLFLSIIPILNLIWAIDSFFTLINEEKMEKTMDTVLKGIRK